MFCKSSFSNVLPVVGRNQKCSAPNCMSCQVMALPKQLTYNNLKIKLDFSLNCKADNVIYVARCSLCQADGNTQLYFGQTCTRFHLRLNGHRSHFKTDNSAYEKSALSMHIFSDHVAHFDVKLDNFVFGIIKQLAPRDMDRVEDFYISSTRADISGLNRYKVCN